MHHALTKHEPRREHSALSSLPQSRIWAQAASSPFPTPSRPKPRPQLFFTKILGAINSSSKYYDNSPPSPRVRSRYIVLSRSAHLALALANPSYLVSAGEIYIFSARAEGKVRTTDGGLQHVFHSANLFSHAGQISCVSYIAFCNGRVRVSLIARHCTLSPGPAPGRGGQLCQPIWPLWRAGSPCQLWSIFKTISVIWRPTGRRRREGWM